MTNDERALMMLLDSTPILGRQQQDLLREDDYAVELARLLGGRGSEAETRELVHARDLLQEATRTGVVTDGMRQMLDHVRREPAYLDETGLRWELAGPRNKLAAAAAVILWSEVTVSRPGRLRPCSNTECRRFVLDRTKGNTTRWCSMATCGNRMKARRHNQKKRLDTPRSVRHEFPD